VSEGHSGGCSWCFRIAELAPSLREAELRVLLELTRRWALAGSGADLTVSASSRELARRLSASRPFLQRALDSLAARGLLSVVPGTATAPAAYTLQFVRTVRLGGSVAEPPPTENAAVTATSAGVEVLTPTAELLIDGINSATPQNLDKQTLVAVRGWLHRFMELFGRDDEGGPVRNPHPPSDRLVARFVAVGPSVRRLEVHLNGLLAENQAAIARGGAPRHTPRTYEWFVTVAVQRIWRISYYEQKAVKPQLRDVKKQGRRDDPEWQQQTLDAIGDLARAKKL
jgi:hypothetical protein